MRDTAMPTLAYTPVSTPSQIRHIRQINHPSDISQPQHQARDAALTLDASGFITHCTAAAAALLGQSAERLAGQAVGAVIHKLPLGALTPGYNLAFAMFTGTQGRWLERLALLPDGRQLPVAVALACERLHGKRHIRLGLRPLALASVAVC